jgi:dTDP-glucose pyrophosphorylase/CBS domain-containing protein
MYKNEDINKICVDRSCSVRHAIEAMDLAQSSIILVVNEDLELVGTVTDGDVRRGLLSNIDFEISVEKFLERKQGTHFECPVTALAGQPDTAYIDILQKHRLNVLPLLDAKGKVLSLVTLGDLLPEQELSMSAVVMAGGQGKRLQPLTENTPKPMLPVGEHPLLERTIKRLRDAGISRVNITTHYKPEKITEYFGDGKALGMELNYVHETCPLGTAGALGVMAQPEEPMLVINGDILTEVDFSAMLDYHHEHEAVMTVAVRKYDVQIPYGVVECKGSSIVGLHEKPLHNFFVNAGIYLLQPEVYRYIENGKQLDMTQLIQRLLQNGEPVISFPIREYWLDIGQMADYERAQEDHKSGKLQ